MTRDDIDAVDRPTNDDVTGPAAAAAAAADQPGRAPAASTPHYLGSSHTSRDVSAPLPDILAIHG